MTEMRSAARPPSAGGHQGIGRAITETLAGTGANVAAVAADAAVTDVAAGIGKGSRAGTGVCMPARSIGGFAQREATEAPPMLRVPPARSLPDMSRMRHDGPGRPSAN